MSSRRAADPPPWRPCGQPIRPDGDDAGGQSVAPTSTGSRSAAPASTGGRSAMASTRTADAPPWPVRPADPPRSRRCSDPALRRGTTLGRPGAVTPGGRPAPGRDGRRRGCGAARARRAPPARRCGGRVNLTSHATAGSHACANAARRHSPKGPPGGGPPPRRLPPPLPGWPMRPRRRGPPTRQGRRLLDRSPPLPGWPTRARRHGPPRRVGRRRIDRSPPAPCPAGPRERGGALTLR